MAVHYHTGAFPPQKLDYAQLFPLIGPAREALGRYDAILGAVPNPSILLSPLLYKEATVTSRIEGTYATLTEVLEYQAAGRPTPTDDRMAQIQEVHNYRLAVDKAIELSATLPLSVRFLKEVHATLMSGVRGRDKAPGRLRTIQNYIGTEGLPTSEARFVPISPLALQDGMAALEKFIHGETKEDPLVCTALVHAEFEALHPFLDGNGRLGRLIVPLYMVHRKILSSPNFYVSDYMADHKQEYVDALLAISRDGAWTEWVAFFLRALESQARTNEGKAKAILELYRRKKEWLMEKANSKYAVPILDFLFEHPIFSRSELLEHVECSPATAKRVFSVVEQELLMELEPSSGRRPATWCFPELLNTAEGRQIF